MSKILAKQNLKILNSFFYESLLLKLVNNTFSLSMWHFYPKIYFHCNFCTFFSFLQLSLAWKSKREWTGGWEWSSLSDGGAGVCCYVVCCSTFARSSPSLYLFSANQTLLPSTYHSPTRSFPRSFFHHSLHHSPPPFLHPSPPPSITPSLYHPFFPSFTISSLTLCYDFSLFLRILSCRVALQNVCTIFPSISQTVNSPLLYL